MMNNNLKAAKQSTGKYVQGLIFYLVNVETQSFVTQFLNNYVYAIIRIGSGPE